MTTTNEEIRKTCQERNCEKCIPIGKRSKRNSIRDGRFDTKEDCCKTRFGETGCPQSLRIKMEEELSKNNAEVRKKTLDSFDGFINAYRREDEDGHDYVSVFALQNHIDYLREQK